MSDEFGGCYRAMFLSADLLGNVVCMVPAVSGTSPIDAFSADFDLGVTLTPGALGWVVFEGGNPAVPVWIGTAAPGGGSGRATVLATSPFTIRLNGVTVVSPAHSPNYVPIVGDTVVVLLDGATPYVLDRTNVVGPIGARVYRNVDQTIVVNTPTAITFTTRDGENPSGLIWDSATALYCPVGAAGKFLAIARVRWSSSPQAPTTAIVKNGVTAIARDTVSISSGTALGAGSTQEAVGTVDMVTNDLVQLIVNYTGGTGVVEGQAGSSIAPRSPTIEMWRLS